MKKNTKKTTQNIGVSNKFVLPNSVTNINSSVIRKGKLKRFDKAGVYGDQIGTLVDDNGNPVTGPSSQIKQSKEGLSAGTIAGIGNAVSTVSSALPSQDPRSASSYFKNIGTNAGSLAATGAAVGGGWGALAGAVVGAGIGTYQSISAANQYQDKINQEKRNIQADVSNQNSGMMRADYNYRNPKNNVVPGLKNGIAKFNSGGSGIAGTNAMVANEEAVKDGSTGKLNVVPGDYNQSNPDRVEANLTEGTSVYSKNPAQTLPFGKSTPADIMSRAARVQKNSDEILSGKTKLSQVDRNTAKLNNANIEAQSRLLNMNTAIEHAEQGNGKYNNGKYDKGKPGVIYAKHFTDGVLGWDGGKIGTASQASEFETMYPGYKRFTGSTTVPSEYSGLRSTMASGVNRDLGAELDKLGVKDWNEKGFKIPNKVADSWYGGDLNPNITGPTYKSGTRFNYDFVVGNDGNVYSTRDITENQMPSPGQQTLNVQSPNVTLPSISDMARKKSFKFPNISIGGNNTKQKNISNDANTASTQAQNTTSGAIVPSIADNGLEGTKTNQNNTQQAQTVTTINNGAAISGDTVGGVAIGDNKKPVIQASNPVQVNNPYSVIPKTIEVQNNKTQQQDTDAITGADIKLDQNTTSNQPEILVNQNQVQNSTSTSSSIPQTTTTPIGTGIGSTNSTQSASTQGQYVEPKLTVKNENSDNGNSNASSVKGIDSSSNGNGVVGNGNKPTVGLFDAPNNANVSSVGTNGSTELKNEKPIDTKTKKDETANDNGNKNTISSLIESRNPKDISPSDLENKEIAVKDAKLDLEKKALEDAKKAEDNGDGYKYEFKNNSNKDWSSSLASLAPTAYNFARSLEGPEIVNPRYSRYMNPDKRYNIAPELAEQKKQRNIARYNMAASGGGRNLNSAYASDVYAKGTDALSKTMATAELANQGYRSEYANLYNQYEEKANQERIRVDDLNARNRAASNAYKARIAEDVSRFAQNQQLMKNQKESDMLSSKVWEAVANSTDPAKRDEILRMVSAVTGVDFVKVAKNKPTIKKPESNNDKNNGGRK